MTILITGRTEDDRCQGVHKAITNRTQGDQCQSVRKTITGNNKPAYRYPYTVATINRLRISLVKQNTERTVWTESQGVHEVICLIKDKVNGYNEQGAS